MVEYFSRNIMVSRPNQAKSIGTIAQHEFNFGIESVGRDRIDDRLQVRAAAGNKHRDREFLCHESFSGADNRALRSFPYFADHVTLLAEFRDRLQHSIAVTFRDHKSHTQSVVKSTIHFVLRDRADLLNHRKY